MLLKDAEVQVVSRLLGCEVSLRYKDFIENGSSVGFSFEVLSKGTPVKCILVPGRQRYDHCIVLRSPLWSEPVIYHVQSFVSITTFLTDFVCFLDKITEQASEESCVYRSYRRRRIE